MNKAATASSQWDSSNDASTAIDGDSINTRWNSVNGTGAGGWLEIDLGSIQTINSIYRKRVCKQN
uniref:discoidin domain-containing protein n=1 Tax=Paenibacillus sp. FSL R10-2734 TaxID=2954691 RepID=UPI00403F0654